MIDVKKGDGGMNRGGKRNEWLQREEKIEVKGIEQSSTLQRRRRRRISLSIAFSRRPEYSNHTDIDSDSELLSVVVDSSSSVPCRSCSTAGRRRRN